MLDIIRQTSVHRNFSFQSRIGLYWDCIHFWSCFVSKSNSDVFWSVSQQVSGPGLYTTDIFLLVQTTVFMRARVHVCLMANEGRIPLSSQRQSWQPPVIILWGLGLIWALQHGPQTLSTHLVGFFESFISTLRCQYIHNTYTLSILPPETSKRERLSALMMITGQWSGHTVEEKREFDGQENIDLKGDLRK